MLNKIMINTKIWIMFSVIMLSLTIITGTTVYGFLQISKANNELSTVESPFHNTAVEFNNRVQLIMQQLLKVSATQGMAGMDEGFVIAADIANTMPALIDELARLDPDQTEFYNNQLLPHFNDYYNLGIEMAQGYMYGGTQDGNAMVPDFNIAAKELTRTIDMLLQGANQRKSAFMQFQQDLAREAIMITAAAAVLIGVFLIGGMLLLAQAIKPLGRLKNEALRIANRDLSESTLTFSGYDEVSQLGAAVEQMRIQLADSIHEIADSTVHVTDTVNGMTQLANRSREIVSSQHAEVNQMASALREMSATVKDVAKNTSIAADEANKASNQVAKGSNVVGEIMQAINNLASGLQDTSGELSELESRSQEIGSVLDVICGIAEQTNLLALNAAIEAARAGEQGRGFAVVADEVRTLAQRTQNSTQEIQNLIENLQMGAERSVYAMKRSLAHSEETVCLSKDTDESLAAIQTSVESIRDMSNLIANATEQQSAAEAEINRMISNLLEMTEATTEGTEQVHHSSESLKRLSNQLQTLVSKFS